MSGCGLYGARRHLDPWIFIPFWLLLVNSFKTQGEAGALSLGLTSQWKPDRELHHSLRHRRLLIGLQNSLIIAVPHDP